METRTHVSELVRGAGGIMFAIHLLERTQKKNAQSGEGLY